ncbi:hypothetical protein M0813_03630 [Anaeramoeba flamelloides]|uniref:Uncharacterized protein n=1 Tax=Anaeramoeba flamelloides TaxID=1746091 RepID=A0ABQ8XS95_9EUKA|nr:hypothetical protein M0813_03630 [Anaeramoeba flamelloides]
MTNTFKTNKEKETHSIQPKKNQKSKESTQLQRQRVFSTKGQSTKTKVKSKRRQQEQQYQQKRNSREINKVDPNDIFIAMKNYEKYVREQSEKLRKQQQVYDEAIEKFIMRLLKKLDDWMATIGEGLGQLHQLNKKHFHLYESNIENINMNNIKLFKKLANLQDHITQFKNLF